MKERQKYRPSIPVVSVGNISVGGSGKTPIVSLLAEHFTEKGYTVALLCRGYGGQITSAHCISKEDSAQTVGDEPFMLFKQDVAAQVWVGADRRISAQKAEEAGASLIILDDGFQHWRLARDVDIVAIGPQSIGNGYLLPAGPLREKPESLTRADIAISLKDASFSTTKTHHIKVDRTLNNQDLAPLLGRDVFAFCGIGHPQQFYKQLVESEIRLVGRKTFPDHHPYNEEELREVFAKASTQSAQIVTTEKDAVKLDDAFLKRVRVVRTAFDEKSKNEIISLVEKLLSRAEQTLKNTQKNPS